ncbi:GspE/PulE family protein [Eubacterium sp. 1001713B170207_170306_E7]|uniref:GspE/PulE family protein n=1 Tax=Eubacterium sp. 1001713B170207_170306_E7 TaxID=2787097 RepID=UPI00189BC583|nr:GspE/PulE family protein [Eubacterium sp. 1001713B170207_170306_E7]
MEYKFWSLKKKTDIEPRQSQPQDNRFVRLVNSITRFAVQKNASDIHFEVLSPDKMRIRIRIDGELVTVMMTDEKDYLGMVSRIKILSGLDISEKRRPQDGSFCFETEGRKIDLRVSVVPTVYHEKAVLRILDAQTFLIPVKRLGFTLENEQRVMGMLNQANGLLLVTGPTGCGKTTTLYSLMKEKNTQALNIITIEDPVEFHLEGINQIQVNERIGLGFGEGLRAILRQDPNVIMVGEIRDEETAATAVRAAITGHLVLSTLHTNDALSTITRLLDMGAADYLLATALRGIIAQRLLRKLCPHCRKAYTVTEAECRRFSFEQGQILYRADGCEKCRHTGYLGRKGIFEVLSLNQSLREAVHSGASYEQLLRLARSNGLVQFSQIVRNEILNGVTDVAEGLRVMSYGNDEIGTA